VECIAGMGACPHSCQFVIRDSPMLSDLVWYGLAHDVFET